jgi:hypothetical protein
MVEFLTKPVKSQMATLIVAALGFLLALQYNEYFKNILDSFLPPTEGLGTKAIVLIILTIVIVYGSVYIKKGLK